MSNLVKNSINATPVPPPYIQDIRRTGGFFGYPDTAFPPDGFIQSLNIRSVTGLGHTLPVFPNNFEMRKTAFITSSVGEPTMPSSLGYCEVPPSTTSTESFIECLIQGWGRYALSSRVINVVDLLKIKHQYINEFSVNGRIYSPDAPGSGFASAATASMSDSDYLRFLALRKEMATIAQVHHNWFAKKFWTGDPQVAATGGGYREFAGLNLFIRDDYATPATGINVDMGYTYLSAGNALLNSLIVDFDDTIGNQPMVNGVAMGIVEVLNSVYAELQMKAMSMALDVQWVAVMRKEIFDALCLVYPLEASVRSMLFAMNEMSITRSQIHELQANAYSGLAAQSSAEGMAMRNNLILPLHDGTIPVVIDNAYPATTTTANPNMLTSDVLFLPTSVNGEPVLFWEHLNYAEIAPAVAEYPFPTEHAFYSDAGRWLWTNRQDQTCFQLICEVEPRLIFRAPHFAGKVTGIRAHSFWNAQTYNEFAPTVVDPAP